MEFMLSPLTRVRFLWPERLAGQFGTIEKACEYFSHENRGDFFYCIEVEGTREYVIGLGPKEVEMVRE